MSEFYATVAVTEGLTMSTLLVSRGIAALQDHVLVQCGSRDVADLKPLLRPGTGLVITAKDADKTVRPLRKAGVNEPLLADARRYSGVGRAPASSGVSSAWISAQRAAGVTAPLTDSGYVAAGDVRGLRTILQQTQGLGGDVVATLPLAQSWLRNDLPGLIGEINAHGVPIALIIEHAADPFAVFANLVGLVAVLRAAAVPVVVLRTDTSGLGALAHGAAAVGFGVRSSLRHLCPPGKGFATRAREAALFKPGLYIVHVDRLALGYAVMPSDPMWLCWCSICGGATVDRLALKTSAQVLAHTLEGLLDLRDHLVVAPPGPLREQSWRAQCASAEYQFTSVALSRAGWSVPRALQWWQQV